MSADEYEMLLNGLKKLNDYSRQEVKDQFVEKLFKLELEEIKKEDYVHFITELERIYTFQPESYYKDKVRKLLEDLRVSLMNPK